MSDPNFPPNIFSDSQVTEGTGQENVRDTWKRGFLWIFQFDGTFRWQAQPPQR